MNTSQRTSRGDDTNLDFDVLVLLLNVLDGLFGVFLALSVPSSANGLPHANEAHVPEDQGDVGTRLSDCVAVAQADAASAAGDDDTTYGERDQSFHRVLVVGQQSTHP